MHTARAALALSVSVVLLTAAARAPKIASKAPARHTAVRPNSPIVTRLLRSLSMRDKIAQLIVMPCYGEAMNTSSQQFARYEHYVRDLHVGGLIVLGHILEGTIRNAEPFAMAAVLNRMQRLSRVPLLTSADFERGASMRVYSTTRWPYNMAFGAAHDLDDVRYQGAFTAREARALGISWVFAPDADVNNNPDNPIINIRSYGENPEDVASFVRAYIEGAHSERRTPVLVTAKHFPGHGDTAVDSHMQLPRLDVTRERLEQVEFVPFRAAIAAGVDSIMTAHIAVPAIDPATVPSTISEKVLSGVLRDELNFRGIVVTDAMDMRGLTQLAGPGEAAVRALEAGVDVLLMPEDAEKAIDGVTAAVRSGRISRRRLDESVTRVLNAKVHLGLFRKKTVDIEAIGDVIDAREPDERAQRVAERAITLVKNDGNIFPVRNPASACLMVLAESRRSEEGRTMLDVIRKRAPGMKTRVLDPGMSSADLDAAAESTKGCSQIVIAAYATVGAYRGNVALPGEFSAFVNRLTGGTVPVTLISLGNPYLVRSFTGVKAYVATFSTTVTSEIAAARAMLGEIPITGRLPVTIPGVARYGDGIQLGAIAPAAAPVGGL